MRMAGRATEARRPLVGVASELSLLPPARGDASASPLAEEAPLA